MIGIKASEHRQIEMLGRLQAAMSVLDEIALPRGEAAKYLEDGRNLIRKAMLRQWGDTEYLISQDDT